MNEKENFGEDILDRLGEFLEEKDRTVTRVREDVRERILEAYLCLSSLYGRERVRRELFAPYRFCGSVSAAGKELACGNPHELAEMVRRADAFEIYPKMDGKVQMNFSYDNLME